VAKSEIFFMERVSEDKTPIQAVEKLVVKSYPIEFPDETKINQWDWIKDLRSSEILKVYNLVVSEKTGRLIGFMGRDRFEKKNAYVPLEQATLEAKADVYFGEGIAEPEFQSVPSEFEELNQNELLFLSAYKTYPEGTLHHLIYMRNWMGSDILRDETYRDLIRKGFAFPFVQKIGGVHLTGKGYRTAQNIPLEIYESLIVTEGDLKKLAFWLFSFMSDDSAQGNYRKSFSASEIIGEMSVPKEKETLLIKNATERGIIIEVSPRGQFILGPLGVSIIEKSLLNNSK
jgi:hypothetical protein